MYVRLGWALVIGTLAECKDACPPEWDDDSVRLLQSHRLRQREVAEISLEEAIQKAGELAKQLTFDEKFGLVKGVGYSSNDWNPPYGYFVGNAAAVKRLKIPALNLQDNGQGYRTTNETIIGKVTAFPSTLAVAATWDKDLGFVWGQALGEEFHAKGGNVLLGPGLNVHRVARCGRNVEYLSGESSYLGAELVKGYIKGVHSKNVLTVMKHFILNSQETQRSFVDSIATERTLWEVYYPPFKGAIEAGCLSAMCSYNLVNGVHGCANPDTMQSDLKDRLGFKGWIMSDWWALHSFSAEQGLDQEMPGNEIVGNAMNQVYFTKKNLRRLPEEKLNEMVTRILTPVVKYGLIENPVCNPEDGGCLHEIYEVNVHSKKHKDLARKMVAESVVLLKNENALPFRHVAKKTIAVLGSACEPTDNTAAMLQKWDLGNYYTVGGSGRVIPKDPVSILQGIRHECRRRGCHVVPFLKDDAAAAAAAAESADMAVLCAGASSAEGADRANLSVDQQEFVVELAPKLKIPTVAVTLIPGAILTPWKDNVDAFLAVFLAGEATGHGIADVLFGEVNPGAKLPVTFPVKEEDTILPCMPPPDLPSLPTASFKCPFNEGLMAGFPHYEMMEVQYPFGHGLSYTTFSYGLESAHGGQGAILKVKVTNTGAVSGSEVVQLYVVFPPGLGEPKKGVLRGFQKVLLDPSKSTSVELTLSKEDLSIYSETGWNVPAGTFQLLLGSSSRDIRLPAIQLHHENEVFSVLE